MSTWTTPLNLARAGFRLAAARSADRRLGRWLLPSLLPGLRRPRKRGSDVHLLFCIADHFEPKVFDPPLEVALGRIALWAREYPRQLGGFRDSDGRPLRHTFFYPIDQYEPELLDALGDFCRTGYGEVEVHLHHKDDTDAGLRATLLDFKDVLVRRHGLLPRDRETGESMYAFVHGDWALDNSHPEGRWCGVNNELDVLRETGCYADFTLPSAPSGTQTRKINSIYYARDDPRRPKSHDWGVDVGAGPAPADGLMMIQGPLVLDWRRRKWGLAPSLENSCLQVSQPPSLERLELWLRARVQVPTRPDWFFVKLYAHGAPEFDYDVLFGETMVRFHQALRRRAEQDPHFYYHYVTAREMYNLARAAEAGWTGSVADARDFRLVWDTCRGSTPAGPL